jgi:short subunit dehydrogenase-like uncharacterized protein
MPKAQREQLDVIVYGATSFVGKILCRYLMDEFGTPGQPGRRKLRWGIAGRSRPKLDALLVELNTNAQSLDVLAADASDEAALTAMAQRTKVVVSTVGPYALYGDTLVKVCAEHGIDYCDLTGEAHWVKRVIDANEAAARKSGARIVPCCGFDSIPSDLGVQFLQQETQRRFGAPCVAIKMRTKAMRGAASGGTVASMVNIIAEATRDAAVRKVYTNPYSLCPTAGTTHRARQHNIQSPEFDADFDSWMAPFIMSAINARVVLRSHALAGFPGGAEFRYDEGMMTGGGFKGRMRAATFTAGLGAFAVGAAVGPARWLMEKTILPAPGSGPSPEAQQTGFWDFRFVGRTAGGKTLKAKVTGDRDPGYGSTAKMLGEAAACLAQDISKSALPGGIWTPSTAMGESLRARLVAHAGVTFEVLE